MPPKLLHGKTVVFTGKLTMTRAEAKAMAERSGASVVSTVTNACNVIVTGSRTGSKLDKALAKGIEIWDEADFIRRMTVEEHQGRLSVNKGRIIKKTGKTQFQFSLAWDAHVDLDLHCHTPKGDVYFGNKKEAGVTLDVDRMPGVDRWNHRKKTWDVDPVENIVCNRAKPGNYKVTVVLYSNHYHGRGAAPFTVHYRLGDYEDVFRGKLTRRGSEAKICEFRVAPNGTFKIRHTKKN
ncbi:MAG TPA: BRCT domain-containing protein [Kofleriaceae bacterium]|nr:BRCT domain-containing protein [Kofleriaceae bacterium]